MKHGTILYEFKNDVLGSGRALIFFQTEAEDEIET